MEEDLKVPEWIKKLNNIIEKNKVDVGTVKPNNCEVDAS